MKWENVESKSASPLNYRNVVILKKCNAVHLSLFHYRDKGYVISGVIEYINSSAEEQVSNYILK